MAFDYSEFVAFWRDREDDFLDQMYEMVRAELPSYAAMSAEMVRAGVNVKAKMWQELLLTSDITPILERTRAVIRTRMSEQIPLFDVLKTNDFFHDALWQMIYRWRGEQALPYEELLRIENWLRQDRDTAIEYYNNELRSIRNELLDRENQLEAQSSLIRELSTPIVPVADNVLVVPLVGTLDTRRATQLMESALERIVEAQADVLVLDLTGVPVVDQDVAFYLMQLSRAVRMIGGTLMLVGISSATAQTIVHLGVDLSEVQVRANLQQAIAEVVARE